MTIWTKFGGVMLSASISCPAWAAQPPAGTLPAAPMPSEPIAAPTPIPDVPPQPATTYPPSYSVPYQAPTTLAPQTQAWVNQASPGAVGAYPAYTTPGSGPGAGVGPYWAPGGYEPRIGSPYYYHDSNGGQFVNTGNPYYDHYGPGFHRHSLHGHYRFPYYTYRAPWYYPGRAVYNRDTNQPW